MGILLMMTAADLSQASATAKKPAAAPAVKRAPVAPVVAPLTLPATAVANGPNQWTHTDAQGKEWIYRQGPFGLTRAPKQAPVTESRMHEGITVTEQGNTVRFSRQGPFGVTEWTKKMDEVNDVERAAIEKSRAPKQKQ
ncbi:MAG: hypothetical protein K2X03_14600 [Bryobacteraceae bacterium]|nr:hypothetical protein [Bryobacteraceae bacterium]